MAQTKQDVHDAESRQARFNSQLPGNTYLQLKAARDVERKQAVRDGLIPDESKPMRLEDAIDFVGTCLDMCPAFEREERAYQQGVDQWERLPGSRLMDPSLAVKAYHRPAAGNEQALPSDVRPPHILKHTLDYLFHVLMQNNGIGPTHAFIRDRTRSIRQDFTMQHERGLLAVECHERIARYHILCLHVLGTDVNFSEQQETEQLKKVLQSLIEFYEDGRSTYNFPNEPEFRAYHTLIHLRDPDSLYQIESLPTHIYTSPLLSTALSLRALVQRNNESGRRGKLYNTVACQSSFAQFFSILSKGAGSGVGYLMVCILESHFGEIRVSGLRALSKCFTAQHRPCPLDVLTIMLGMDDVSHTESIIRALGIEIQGNGVKLHRGVDIGATNLPLLPSERIIEPKRVGYSDQDIIDGKDLVASSFPSSFSTIKSSSPASFASNGTFQTPFAKPSTFPSLSSSTNSAFPTGSSFASPSKRPFGPPKELESILKPTPAAFPSSSPSGFPSSTTSTFSSMPHTSAFPSSSSAPAFPSTISGFSFGPQHSSTFNAGPSTSASTSVAMHSAFAQPQSASAFGAPTSVFTTLKPASGFGAPTSAFANAFTQVSKFNNAFTPIFGATAPSAAPAASLPPSMEPAPSVNAAPTSAFSIASAFNNGPGSSNYTSAPSTSSFAFPINASNSFHQVSESEALDDFLGDEADEEPDQIEDNDFVTSLPDHVGLDSGVPGTSQSSFPIPRRTASFAMTEEEMQARRRQEEEELKRHEEEEQRLEAELMRAAEERRKLEEDAKVFREQQALERAAEAAAEEAARLEVETARLNEQEARLKASLRARKRTLQINMLSNSLLDLMLRALVIDSMASIAALEKWTRSVQQGMWDRWRGRLSVKRQKRERQLQIGRILALEGRGYGEEEEEKLVPYESVVPLMKRLARKPEEEFLKKAKRLDDFWKPGTFLDVISQCVWERARNGVLPIDWSVWLCVDPKAGPTSRWLRTKFAAEYEIASELNVFGATLPPSTNDPPGVSPNSASASGGVKLGSSLSQHSLPGSASTRLFTSSTSSTSHSAVSSLPLSLSSPGLLIIEYVMADWQSLAARIAALISLLPSSRLYVPSLLFVLAPSDMLADFPKDFIKWVNEWSDMTIGWLILSHTGPPPEEQVDEALVSMELDVRGMASPTVGIQALTQSFIDAYVEAVEYVGQVFARSSGRTAFRWAFLGAFTQAVDEFVSIICQECEVDRPWEAWPNLTVPGSVRSSEDALRSLEAYLTDRGLRIPPRSSLAELQEITTEAILSTLRQLANYTASQLDSLHLRPRRYLTSEVVARRTQTFSQRLAGALRDQLIDRESSSLQNHSRNNSWARYQNGVPSSGNGFTSSSSKRKGLGDINDSPSVKRRREGDVEWDATLSTSINQTLATDVPLDDDSVPPSISSQLGASTNSNSLRTSTNSSLRASTSTEPRGPTLGDLAELKRKALEAIAQSTALSKKDLEPPWNWTKDNRGKRSEFDWFSAL